MRSIIKIHGGKYYLAPKIVSLFPSHNVYVEPFFGSGAVLLAKPKSEIEIASDCNPDVINVWKIVQSEPGDLQHYLSYIPYNQISFENAEYELASSDDFDRAAAYIIRNRFSRGGFGVDFAKSSRLRGKQNEQINSWETIIKLIPTIAKRVKHVQFHCCYAHILITQNDSSNTLMFLDPPYVARTRTTPKIYDYEMGDHSHQHLVNLIKKCESKIFLSGYDNPIYNKLEWKQHEFQIANHSGQGKIKNKRTEILWEN